MLQHASFIFAGILVWWPALEPKRRQLRGELWKIGHIISARMLGMFLGMAFVLIREPVYTGVYDPVERRGFSAMADQQTAGAMMVGLDILIMVFALAYFFWHAAQQYDRDEAKAAARRTHVDAGRVGAAPAASREPLRRRGRPYSTVSVPSMPPSRWPGTEQ